MFIPTQKLIFILILLNLKDSVVISGYSKCLKLPNYHSTQLTLYKDEVNAPPSNLTTSMRLGDNGGKLVVFEFKVPQKGNCFWEEQVCLTSPSSEDESCDKYNNQSMWFVLPFHNYFRTYKVSSLAYDGDNENGPATYSWTSAYQCAILFQKEEDRSSCTDFEHALSLKEKEIFLTATYDFKSVLIQPGCHLMQYVVGEWEAVEMEGMFEFSEEATQYYCHCEEVNKFELGVTTVFPPNYKAEKVTGVPWVWEGMVTDDLEAVSGENISWKTNAVLFLSESESARIIMKGMVIIVMMIAVIESLLLRVYIWLGIEDCWD